METVGSLLAWIGANEAILSGLAATIVIVGVLFTPLGRGLRVYLRTRRERDVLPAGAAESARGVDDRPSIAVLPFANLSGDAGHEYLADGMSEDIITGLSRVRQFTVIARNSSFSYKGRSVDVREVSSDLGVRYVLEGSVRPVGERLRVTAQLIDATCGEHVWSDRWDRPLADIFDVQDEVTEAIVGALLPALRRAEAERARRAPPESLDAWALVNQAWTVLQTDLEDRDQIARAIDAAERAIGLDPEYTLARAVLAYALGLDVSARELGDPQRPAAAERAERAARDAVERDPDDPLVQQCYGVVMANLGRTDEAVRAYERSLRIDPNNAQARAALGIAQMFQHRVEECVEPIDRAMRLSPRDPLAYHWLAYRALASAILGDFERAERDARDSVERRPNALGYGSLAIALAHTRRPHDAHEAYLRFRSYYGPEVDLATWDGYTRLVGRTEEQRARLADGMRRAAEAP